MNEAHQKALEAAVSHGFRKNDFVSLGHALIGECEQRTHVQKEIKEEIVTVKEQVLSVAQAVSDITNEDFVAFDLERQSLRNQLESTTNELNALKAELAGDEDGVLRIQTLYVG